MISGPQREKQRWSSGPTLVRELGRRLRWIMGLGVGGFVGWADPPASVITDVSQIWSLSGAEWDREYDLRFEGVINFADPAWGNLWFNADSQGLYTMLRDRLPELRPGRRVRIEGTLVPRIGLQRDRIRVTVLEEGVTIPPLDARGRIGDAAGLDRQVVLAEGFVDTQQLIDDQHLRLITITENRAVVVWVVPDDPLHLPSWPGAFVRVTGVYSGRIDPSGNDSTIEIWVAQQQAVAVQYRVTDEPRFRLPVTRIDEARTRKLGDWIHVQGVVERRQVGQGVLVRGDGGDIFVRSIQRAVIPRGAAVEAVGRLKSEGARWVMDEALIRAASPAAEAAIDAAARTGRARIAQVRALSAVEADEGKVMELAGTVLWSYPTEPFFFLADSTGGVRVKFDPQRFAAPALNKLIQVSGRTWAGDSGPEIDLTAMTGVGTRAHPTPQTITVAQALNGGMDAQWVELRGFLQEVVSVGDWRRIHVTTPTGEFVAQLNSPVNFVANPGSLLIVRGVCEVLHDPMSGGPGVQLRVPFLHDITVEEEAPEELFDLPLRSVASLESLLGVEDMLRVRVRAAVIQARTGEPLAVVDAATGLRILTQDPTAVPLQPGDLIEAAGILGRDDGHLVLRDAVVRQIGAASGPAPVLLDRVQPVQVDLNLRLVEAEGVVVNTLKTANELRLTLQRDGDVFDVVWSHPGAEGISVVPASGSRVRVRGLYDVRFARGRKPIGFTVQLGSAADVTVLAPPSWLTTGRALAIVGVFASLALLGAVGALVMRRRVAKQTEQIRQQMEREAHLEGELERDRRLKAIGSLAGGIAHDFNNLLTGILGNLSLMVGDTALRSRFGPNLDDALGATNRARSLTAQLSTLASGGAPVRQRIDLVPWLRDVIERTVPRDWNLVWTSHIGHLDMEVDTEQLGQAVKTLVRYFVSDAVRDGRIDALVRMENAAAAEEGEPERVLLELRDNGPRPEPAKLAEIFDPYSESYFGEDRFALALAFSIAKRHGGGVSATAAPDGGGGTVFRLVLPVKVSAGRTGPPEVVPRAVLEADPVLITPPPTLPKGQPAAERLAADVVLPTTTARAAADIPPKTRVLVMDDEPPVARVIHRVLERLGYDVVVTADGEACIAAYADALETGRRFDVVVMDLTVPNGIGGAAAMVQLLRLDPGVRAVATSGYSSDSIMANPETHGFVASVRKPFEIKEMRDALLLAGEGK